MEFLPVALTVLAGIAMGWINNVAGGAGVLGLLAFEYGFGLPLDTANPSTRIAAVAIGSMACAGFLRAGRRPPPEALGQALLALPGALVGAQLAIGLPEMIFRSYLAIVMVLLLWQQQTIALQRLQHNNSTNSFTHSYLIKTTTITTRTHHTKNII